jgi:hypothetical protein
VIAFVLVVGSPPLDVDDVLTARLSRFRRDHPECTCAPINRWRSPDGSVRCTWVTHGPEGLGGLTYVRANTTNLSLFCGRPVVWQGERADGRAGLDPPCIWRSPATGYHPNVPRRTTAAKTHADLSFFGQPHQAVPHGRRPLCYLRRRRALLRTEEVRPINAVTGRVSLPRMV